MLVVQAVPAAQLFPGLTEATQQLPGSRQQSEAEAAEQALTIHKVSMADAVVAAAPELVAELQALVHKAEMAAHLRMLFSLMELAAAVRPRQPARTAELIAEVILPGALDLRRVYPEEASPMQPAALAAKLMGALQEPVAVRTPAMVVVGALASQSEPGAQAAPAGPGS